MNFSSTKTLFHIFGYWHDSRWNGFVGASVKIKDLAHNLAIIGNEVVFFLPLCELLTHVVVCERVLLVVDSSFLNLESSVPDEASASSVLFELLFAVMIELELESICFPDDHLES